MNILLRPVAIGILVVTVGALIADGANVLPSPVPFVFGVVAVLAAIAALCGITWSTPPTTPDGIRHAIVVRTAAAAILIALAAWAVMFALAAGFVIDTMWPAMILAVELLIIGAIADRAVRYGRDPQAWNDLLAERAAERRRREQQAAERAARPEPVRAERRPRRRPATVVAVDQVDVALDDMLAPAPAPAPPPAPAVAVVDVKPEPPVAAPAPPPRKPDPVDDPYALDDDEFPDLELAGVDLSGNDDED
jgi:hypothetical protein